MLTSMLVRAAYVFLTMGRYAGTVHHYTPGNATGVVAMASERRRYIAYLLRLWRPDGGLFAFLKEQLDAARNTRPPAE